MEPSKKVGAVGKLLLTIAMLFTAVLPVMASEADLVVPSFHQYPGSIKLLVIGMVICVLGMLFGIFEYLRVKALKVHKAMLEIGGLIYETCKTYLIQQGKFLIVLETIIAVCIAFYFGVLQHMPIKEVGLILAWSVVGILGSYGVAWYGIRMNTLANARTAFASLEAKPLGISKIPLQVGMSIGVLLVSVELLMMLVILLFVPAIWRVLAL
jgi:K(+)-stimulated pyrophosphate-energized sodium pump